MAEDRVQKILARAGYGSRRASEDLITSGRVRINGVVAVLGSKADPQHDTITVDNQPIAREQAPVYIALNKPQGILSEVSPEEPRETVRDLVPIPGHMFIVGRLDLESEGLILLTNDGELANRLTHPRYGHEKEYRVLVGTRPDEEQLNTWRRGIVLEDGHRTAPAQVRLEGLAGKNAWLRVILNEGRKRQIREMGKLTGLPVLRIIRIRIGSLLLGDLKPGQWRQLRPDEIRELRTSKPSQSAMRAPRRETRRPGYKPAAARRTERGEGASEIARRGRTDSTRSGERAGSGGSGRFSDSGRSADSDSGGANERGSARGTVRRGPGERNRPPERSDRSSEAPRRGRSEGPRASERIENTRETPRSGPRPSGRDEGPREMPRRGRSEAPRTNDRSENSREKPRRDNSEAPRRSERTRQDNSQPQSGPRPSRGNSRRTNRNRS